jgi:glutathione S-transferase
MLTLLTYPRNGEVFSLSPFCVKAALLLNHARAHWQREDLRDPRKMPHQKLPVLRTGKRLISDSANIRRYLEVEGADFDPGLSKRERAQAQSLIRMAEDSLYFYVVRDRWDNDTVWPTIRDNYFQEVPFLLRRPVTGAIRRSVHKGLQFQGTGRFSDSERLARLDSQLQAVTDLLEGQDFLFGKRVTSADMSVAAMLQAMASTMVPTPTVERVKGDPVLWGYLTRVFDSGGQMP